MTDDLLCDGCARETWPDGSILLVVQDDRVVKTVRTVRITCGQTCVGTPSIEGEAVFHSFVGISNVFDYADALIAAHDWERGTVQRLSRVLAAVHRRRAP